MAIDIKGLIADAFLELCQNKSLKSITIADLLNKTSVSRQAFYNHFRDKNDLIQWIYKSRILTEWGLSAADKNLDYYNALVDSLQRMAKYHFFMKQACMMTDQNCLRDFMLEYARTFDLTWHQVHYGKEPMPAALRFATEYNMIATMNMVLSWLLSDMPSSPEEMAKQITKLRYASLSKLLYASDEEEQSPYARAMAKIGE